MDQVQLEVLRAEAIAADRSFSKGRLRDEFRMKPKPDATPVAHYKNGYGGTFDVYRIADCLPMRERKAAAPSPKQVRAAAILALKGRMQSKVAKASHVAVQWLATAPLVLDAETTNAHPTHVLGAGMFVGCSVFIAAGSVVGSFYSLRMLLKQSA